MFEVDLKGWEASYDLIKVTYEPQVASYDINLHALAKAHTKAESNFDSNAVQAEELVSDVSAGYMQLRILTTREQADIGSEYSDEQVKQMLLNKNFNVAVGVKYIVYQLKRYEGDIKKAIGAYNAGSAIIITPEYLVAYKKKIANASTPRIKELLQTNYAQYSKPERMGTYINQSYIDKVYKYYEEYKTGTSKGYGLEIALGLVVGFIAIWTLKNYRRS